MKILEHNLHTGERVVTITKEQYDILEAIEKVRKAYPDEDTLVVCQARMIGYNIEEGRYYKMKYEPLEIEENENSTNENKT